VPSKFTFVVVVVAKLMRYFGENELVQFNTGDAYVQDFPYYSRECESNTLEFTTTDSSKFILCH
jgi:hypothetical protein